MKLTELLIAGALTLFSSYALAQDEVATDQKQLLSTAQIDQMVAIDPLELEAALDQDAAMHGVHPM